MSDNNQNQQSQPSLMGGHAQWVKGAAEVSWQIRDSASIDAINLRKLADCTSVSRLPLATSAAHTPGSRLGNRTRQPVSL